MRISDWSSDVCSSDLAIDTLEACSVARAREARKPDTTSRARAAAEQVDPLRRQFDADKVADALEVGEDGIVPIMIEAVLAIPSAGPVLCRLGKLFETIYGRFDNLGHRPASFERVAIGRAAGRESVCQYG